MAYSPTALQLTHVLQTFFSRVNGKVLLATGGSTSTVIDTKLAAELEESSVDNFLIGGTVIVVEDAGGAFAAPEGEFSRITAYDSTVSAPTITVSPALTTAVASGDRYMFVTPDFPLYDMIEVVNRALKYISRIPRFDTSITTAANQTEYTLPLAVKGGRIVNVEMQGITTDANDNRWWEVPHWREGFAAAGSTGTFRILQYSTGYTIRITYMAEHARLSAFADYIDEFFDRNLVDASIFAHALQWKNDNERLSGAPDDNMLALEQKAWSQLDREMARNRPALPPRRIQGFPHWTIGKDANDSPPLINP